MESTNNDKGFIGRLISRIESGIRYAVSGVWKDPSDSMKVRLIKTANLSIRSFLNKDLQSTSMSLTYVTAISLVPALALFLAFGRAFGLQNYLQKELFKYLPTQGDTVNTVMGFVDSYLKQTSRGVFVGIGIVVLLWTIISLMSRVEDSFNKIWDIRTERTFFRKVTDYTALCLFVPVLMLLSSGVSIAVSTTFDDYFSFLSPVVSILLDASPFFLVWIAFTFCFVLIPNTSVKFKYGAIAGFFCGLAFQILQYLFVNGQIYVSNYNAIYGSFAFLPLLMVWLQLSWLILLSGCMITYSAQNVFSYNFSNESRDISQNYFYKVAAVVIAAIIKNFRSGKESSTEISISQKYELPVPLVKECFEKFKTAGLINYVMNGEEKTGVAPATDLSKLTLTDFFRIMGNLGSSEFIPDFESKYSKALRLINYALDRSPDVQGTVYIKDLPLDSPTNTSTPSN